jgi:hypothetical protein
MNTSLQNMQRDFLNSLRKKDALPIEAALMEKPVSKPGLRAYIHAYSSRLTEALDNDHPCLGAYLGDSLWQEMCAGYIEKNPSQYRSLRNFGDLLPDYLLHADAFKRHPEIAELAKLERQFLNCFDAPDSETMDFSEFLKLQPEQWTSLGLAFHPSMQLLAQNFNTVTIWQNIKDKKTPQTATKNKNYWLLWRDSDRITSFQSLDKNEYTFFSHFYAGGNFSGLCEKMAEIYPGDKVPGIALDFLKRWCDQGLIMAIVID